MKYMMVVFENWATNDFTSIAFDSFVFVEWRYLAARYMIIFLKM